MQVAVPPSELAHSRVHVCPLRAVPDVVAGCGAAHLLTCLQGGIVVDTPPLIKPANHVRLDVDDISEPMLGHVVPSAGHIAHVIKFARTWGGRGTAVIHCWAGISRSTAAAFITLCALNPDVPERRIARQLRQASPTAYPNRLMVKLGDAALGRAGRMVDAVESIGRGALASEGHPFSLPADLSALL